MKRLLIKFMLFFQTWRNHEKIYIKNLLKKIKISLLENIFWRYKIVFKIIDKEKNVKYSLVYVSLRDIYSPFGNTISSVDERYNWGKLKKSILKYGVINPPIVRICNKRDIKKGFICKYCHQDGKHRIHLLKKLYPSNHQIKVKLITGETPIINN